MIEQPTPDVDVREYLDSVAGFAGRKTNFDMRLASYALQLEAHANELRQDAEAYRRINTPEIDEFLSAVKNEALHQRERWGAPIDAEKQPAEWFWLVGYLAGKALHDVNGKRLHHIITTSAALLNWHSRETGHYASASPALEASTS